MQRCFRVETTSGFSGICRRCGAQFSDQRFCFDYRLRKHSINQLVFPFVQGEVAARDRLHRKPKPEAITLRVVMFGWGAQKIHLEAHRATWPSLIEVRFDEVETFAHTELKLFTMSIVRAVYSWNH